MTKKHRLLFFFWKLRMALKGIKKGRFVVQYNPETKEDIKGVIVYLHGDSVNKSKYDFGFKVQWFACWQGFDYRYFSQGFFNYSDIKPDKLRLL